MSARWKLGAVAVAICLIAGLSAFVAVQVQTRTTTSDPTTTTVAPPATTTTTVGSGGEAAAGKGAPTAPPVRVCGNAGVLNGPATPPAGAVVVPAGDNSKLAPTGALAANTTYWFAPGVHTIGPAGSAGAYYQLHPANGDTFIGGPGAILDGQNAQDYAFTDHGANVTIEYLTIQNFLGAFNEGVVNHDSGAGWTITHDTIQNTGNTAAGGTNGAAIIGGLNETITWNCLSRNGQYGVNGAGVPSSVGPTGKYTNMLIADNEFDHNAPNGDPVGGTSGAFKLWYDSDVTVKDNWVHDTDGIAMWADTNNNGMIFEGNYVDHNRDSGLVIEISYNALVQHNTFVDNAWDGGGNPGFPTGAIYVFSSGGDSRVRNGLGIATLDISDNVFTDNWSGVVLYQNGDRICGFSDGSNCTLIDPTIYTAAACKANIAETSPIDYADNCVWKTQNASVHDNAISFNQANIPGCKGTQNACGYEALFGTYSAEASHTGDWTDLRVSNLQNNHFAHNTYTGGTGFVGFDQSDQPVTWSQWHNGFADFSTNTGDRFNPQDAGSTFN